MRVLRWKGLAARLLIPSVLSGLVLAGTGLTFAAPAAQQIQTVSLLPQRVGTAGQSRCGQQLAPLAAVCAGFVGAEATAQPDFWVVGYENNREGNQKHVYQAVAVFNLAPLRGLLPGATLSQAMLGYGESSTVRRSPSGDAQYGILPTCNTGLGVPTDGWNGGFNGVVPTRPAAVGGVEPATTGSFGAWDVTPQIQQWLASGGNEHAFVLRGDDESLDVNGQAMCVSYIFDLGLVVDFAVPQ